jgi:hypothetical protein
MLAAAASCPATAQTPGPYNPRTHAREALVEGSSVSAARRTLRQFGTCLVKRARREAARVAQVPIGAPDYDKQWNDLVTSECLLNGTLRIPRPNLRGAVFEALFLSGDPVANPGFGDDLKTGFDAPAGADLSDRARTMLALERFGECVARKQPATVTALLKTEPESDAEVATIGALMPDFSACIPKGETFSFSKTVVRGALAEGMYWLSKAAESGVQATR